MKKSVTTYFIPCIDEDNKKNRNKIRAKMKTLKAIKAVRPKCRKWKARKLTLYIDCARGRRRLGARSNRYARTQKSSNSLIHFRSSNSCSLLETGITRHERLFLAKWHPKAEEKNCENGGFSTPLTGMKSSTVDRGCTPAPKDATKLPVFFRFFRVFPFTFQ